MPGKQQPSRTSLTRQEFEGALIVKAWKDPAFRARLISNPKAVFEEELGVPLPPDLKMTVLEETADHLFLALPLTPEQTSDTDLTEEELQLVTGGSGVPTFLVSLLRLRPK